jgi:sporulation protein YlmC with PRC-barrel domain
MDTHREKTKIDTSSEWGENKRFRRVMSAGTLEGDRVKNPAGEDLGKVEEIMLDVPSGRVAYAVLSFGGFLGMGNKLFAIPWEALTLDEAEKQFILNVDKQTLENAPGFDKDNWPDMADPDFGSQIYGYYGYHPHWSSSAGGLGSGATSTTFDRDRNSTLKGGR